LLKALQEAVTGAAIEGHPMNEFFKKDVASRNAGTFRTGGDRLLGKGTLRRK